MTRIQEASQETEATPIEVLSIRPARTTARTPLNGTQPLKTSLIQFNIWDSKYGLVTENTIKRDNRRLDENIQTLDFREIVVPFFSDKEEPSVNFIEAAPFISKDNKWTNRDFDNSEIARGALDAHFGTSRSLKYFFSEFGRNSIDDKGMILLNAISPIVIDTEGRQISGHNALWNSVFEYDGTKYGMMMYFDGVARDQASMDLYGNTGLFAGIDIVGHEVTHGITELTANLVYRSEPGALNEGFSDIFGTNIKAMVKGSNDIGEPNWTWIAGEDFLPIRNMANPNEFFHPDTYAGQYWQDTGPDPITGYSENDSGGVHTNSGVINYWYALAVEGSGNAGPGKEHPDLLIGSQENYTNDNGYIYKVEGIGLEKMQGVAYRALTKYLGPKSTFADARDATIKAANDLTSEAIARRYPGVPQLSEDDVRTVISAWDAVGVGGGLRPEDNRQQPGNPADLYTGLIFET